MSKLIIENRTDLDMLKVLGLVHSVVAQGKISGSGDKKQYCYAMTFDKYVVWATKNKKSDRVTIQYLK